MKILRKLVGFALRRGAEGSTYGGVSIAAILAYFFNIDVDPKTLKEALQGLATSGYGMVAAGSAVLQIVLPDRGRNGAAVIAALALLGGGVMLAPGQAVAGEAYRMVPAHFFCHTAVPFELMHQRDAAGDDLGVLRVQEAALAQKACVDTRPVELPFQTTVIVRTFDAVRGTAFVVLKGEMRYRGIAVPSFVLATREGSGRPHRAAPAIMGAITAGLLKWLGAAHRQAHPAPAYAAAAGRPDRQVSGAARFVRREAGRAARHARRQAPAPAGRVASPARPVMTTGTAAAPDPPLASPHNPTRMELT